MTRVHRSRWWVGRLSNGYWVAIPPRVGNPGLFPEGKLDKEFALFETWREAVDYAIYYDWGLSMTDDDTSDSDTIPRDYCLMEPGDPCPPGVCRIRRYCQEYRTNDVAV